MPASAISSSRRSQRRQQLDPVAEHDARVRVERDDRRREPGVDRGAQDPLVADVDAVEGAERHRARAGLELLRGTGDRHSAGTCSGSRASASSTGMTRSGSASSDGERPTSVRRSVRQWPPSASAIARTYVPELTRRSRRATPSLIGDDVERVHAGAPERHLDGDAAAVQAVGALAADLDRRGGRDRQLDLPAEAREPAFQLRGVGRRVALELLALRIAGRRPRGQVDVRQVALVEADEARRHLSCPSGQQNQQTGRERVERAGVARPGAGRGGAPRRRSRTRTAGRLVDEEDAGRLEPRGARSGDLRGRGGVLATDEVGDLLHRLLAREARRPHVAAAFPDARAIAETSSPSTFERRLMRCRGASGRSAAARG